MSSDIFLTLSIASPYHLLAGMALLSGFSLALWLSRRRVFPVITPFELLCIGAPFIFLGGKSFYLLTNGGLTDLEAWTGPGYSLYGAFIAVLLVWTAIRASWKFPLLTFLDCVTPAAALALFFARLGCYFNGCCSGIECSLPWAIRYPSGSIPFTQQLRAGQVTIADCWSVPIHPYQLYEASFGLFCVGLLLWMARQKLKPGQTFFTGSLLYGVFRYLIEPLRADFEPWIPALGLSLPQVMSLTMAFTAVGFLIYRRTSATPDE